MTSYSGAVPDTVVVIHRLSEKDPHELDAPSPVFKTCLRQVAFSRRADLDVSTLRAADEVLTGEKAYRALLEIICGLRSPLTAETAVLGQFKRFSESSAIRDWRALRHLCDSLLADAKAIRSAYLDDLPGRCYGSVVRRELCGFRHVAILGAGDLAREILPKLASTTSVELVCRSPEKAADLRERFPAIDIRKLDAPLRGSSEAFRDRSALVVAAPMSGRTIRNWIAREPRSFEKIVDLRGEAERDPLGGASEVVSLPALFEERRLRRKALDLRVTGALSDIRRRARAYAARIEIRPFGWEDLCA